MNKRLRQCGAVLAVLAAGPACAANLVLNCSDSGKAGLEAKRIKAEAGGLVKRLSKHVLQVTVAGKSHKLTDKPPYDEPLDGVRYEFCERKEGFILVAHEDGADFTGKLINEATGNITDAGSTVEFSADRRAYLASSQSNGLDATSLAVHALDGRVSWEGTDTLPHPTRADSMTATLGKIQWEANGELSAQATCLAGKVAPWRVKLVKSGGVWDWQPKRKCPDA